MAIGADADPHAQIEIQIFTGNRKKSFISSIKFAKFKTTLTVHKFISTSYSILMGAGRIKWCKDGNCPEFPHWNASFIKFTARGSALKMALFCI